MAQRLIVEGSDAIALTNLCIKRKLKPPVGYSNPNKYSKEFVVSAGGYDQTKLALEEVLKMPDVTNIGIIVDADNVPIKDRFDEFVEIIKEEIKAIPTDFVLTETGAVAKFSDNLTIGIYIMPDNQNAGYLEHFLANLIAEDDKVYPFAKEKVAEFRAKSFSKITDAKAQKANMHTWLALQKTPGQPFGTAIMQNRFDVNRPSANHFIAWFEATFELKK